jgi:hypothetical protein
MIGQRKIILIIIAAVVSFVALDWITGFSDSFDEPIVNVVANVDSEEDQVLIIDSEVLVEQFPDSKELTNLDLMMQYDNSLTKEIIIENSETRTIIDEIFDAPDYVETIDVTDTSGNISGTLDVLVFVEEIEPEIITEKKELKLTRTLTFSDGTKDIESVNSPNLVGLDLIAIDGFQRDIADGNVKFELAILGNPDDDRKMLVEGEITVIYNGMIYDKVIMSNFTSKTLNANQDNQVISKQYSIKELNLLEGTYPLEFRLDKLIIIYDDYTNEQSQPYQSMYKMNIEKNKKETIIATVGANSFTGSTEWSFQRTFDYDVPVKISANQSLLIADYCMGSQRGNNNCGKVMSMEAIVPAPALGEIKVTEIKADGTIHHLVAYKEAKGAGECTNPSGGFKSRGSGISGFSTGGFSGIDFDLCSSQQGYDYKTELLYGDSRELVQGRSSNYSIFDKITEGGGSLGFTAQYGSSYRIEISDPPKDFIIDVPVTTGEISYSCVFDSNMIRVCNFP